MKSLPGKRLMYDRGIEIEPGSLRSRSNALECLQHCSDKSIYSEQLYRITCTRHDCASISPLQANFGRVLNLESISRVLLLNWGDSVLPSFLGGSGIDIEVEAAGEEVTSLLTLQCGSLRQVKIVSARTADNGGGSQLFWNLRPDHCEVVDQSRPGSISVTDKRRNAIC